jgi:hypothetical protein
MIKTNYENKRRNLLKIIIFLIVLAAISLSANAAGKFNVPLNWVLGPTGTSIDYDNDGLIDVVTDDWVNSTGDKMTGSLIGLDLNMTYGNFSKGMIVLGNVGIGTATPSTALDVSGTVTATSFAGSGSSLTGIISPPWNSSGTNVFLNDTTAKVGIGQTSPNYKLDVLGSINATNVNATGIVQASSFIGDGSSLSGINTDFTNNTDINVTRFVANNTLFVNASRVGIGIAAPTTALEVSGTVTATSFAGDGSSLSGISSATPPWNSSGTNVFLNDSTAKVGIGTSTPTHELHIIGDANITNNLYLGQNLTDLAENIFSAEDVEAGDVVVISKDMKVIRSYKAYDNMAVGVISTAPAAVFGGSTGNVPLAISGRVPVKVTDENGKIRPGDLLTTSSTKGHAMRCSSYEKCFGKIIGKALTSLDNNQGTVIMIVMLN